MTLRQWLAVALLPVLAACGSTPDPAPAPLEQPSPTPGAARPVAPGPVTIDLDGRPFQLHVPESYDPADPAPLVVLLHGYTSSANIQEGYFRLTAESEARGFLYARPDGTIDGRGDQFWNATDACCDFYRSGVDDSAYLSRLIDTVAASYAVDPARVYLVGHSNGGFMAHRMACDHAAQIAAIVSLAGAATADPAQCAPQRGVSVLQIHGTSDETISFDGGANAGNPYPSVAETMALWRDRNGCSERVDSSAAPLDLDSTKPGAETVVTRYPDGCRDGSVVELWSITDGGHVPVLTGDFAPAVMDFLYARTAPA
jgi:polyhydroxybutyrate depolymerase